ncbi:MAG TPA: hypothetical protein VLZ83_10630 [Edaphocola sp.]|nr:hypothetical protein [Edaphocola sp.]
MSTLLLFISFFSTSCSLQKKLSRKTSKIELTKKIIAENSTEVKGALIEDFELLDNDRVYFNAIKQYIVSNYDSAYEGFKYFQKLDTSNAASYFYLAQLEAQSNYLKATLENAHKATLLEPMNKWYQSFYANILTFAEKYDSAANIYFTLGTRNEEERNQSFTAASRLYFRSGETPKAIASIDSILVRDATNEEALLLKQEILLKERDYEEAIEVTKELLNFYPLSPEYYIQLAEIYDIDKDPVKSEATIKILEKKFKGNKDVASYIFGYYLKRRNIDEVAKAMDEYVDAAELNKEKSLKIIGQIGEYMSYNRNDTLVLDYLSELTDSISKNKPNNLIAKQLAASLKLYSSKPDDGVVIYKQLTETYPKNYSIWFPLIEYYNYQNETDSSLKYLNKMEKYFPDSLDIPMNKMFIAHEANNFEEALKYGLKGLDLAQKQKQKQSELMFYNSIAHYYYELKRNKESDSVYEAILVRDPSNIMALNNYAYFLSERGEKLEYALNLSKKTLEEDFNNPNNLDTYGWILYKLGRYEEAKVYVTKAIEASGDNISYVVLEHFADIEFRLGNKDNALKLWKIIDKDGKGSQFLKQKIKDKKIYE